MDYLISKILTEEIEKSGKASRVYGLERNIGEVEFNRIKNGKRIASAKKLSTLLDLELLREPILTDLESRLADLDTETLVEVYNLIYNRIGFGK